MSNLVAGRESGQEGSSEGVRPVGRPSVRSQRREEILHAAAEVILEFGIAGATRSRIAQRAGVRPPAVHHFVGTQGEVLRATIERIGRRLTAELIVNEATIDDPLARIVATIDAAFGAKADQPTLNRLVDELVAHSYRDEATREALAAIYRTATDHLAAEIERAWGPGTSVDARTAAAEIVALAHAAGTFRHLSLGEQADAAYRRAHQLVSQRRDVRDS